MKKALLLPVCIFFGLSLKAQQQPVPTEAKKQTTNQSQTGTKSSENLPKITGGSSATSGSNNTPQLQQRPDDANNNVPQGYPKYIDTGNPERDRAEYANKKQQWIDANPQKYEKIANGKRTPNEAQKIKRSDFNSLPQARKDYILAHPDQFIITEN